MTIQLLSGSILLNGGAIAVDAACCCEEPCECTVLDTYANCNCVDTAYGTKRTAGDATITISGAIGDCSVGACPDISGTYVVACGDSYVDTFSALSGCGTVDLYIYYDTAAFPNKIVVRIDGVIVNCNSKVWTFNIPTNVAWAYVLGGACTTDCNSTRTVSDCSAGSQSWDSVADSGAPFFDTCCDVRDVTATLSIGAST
jgi:hypothetical protein